jgi:acetyl esterase/lipase
LPAFLEDAAAATAWVLRNIGRYGGDSNKVFVAGHSRADI